MANILDFLRGLLTDTETQQVFRADPEGFVSRAGFDDLTGEDVVEAVAVLKRTLLPEVAEALGDYDDPSRLPPVRPGFEERDLDAALRQLQHAVELTSPVLSSLDGGPTDEVPREEPEEPVHDEPIEVEAEPELAEPELAEPEPAAAESEPERAEPEPALAAAPASTPGAGPSGDPAARAQLPSMQALGEAIAVASKDVRTLLEDYAEEVFERLSSIIEVAEQDASSIRTEAERERDTARQVLLDAREEADRIRAEAEEVRQEVESRRTELREAQQQLKERMAGLDSVLQTVLKET